MASRTLPILLLCLLLLQTQGHFWRRKTQARPQGSKPNYAKACEVRPSPYLCTHRCSYFLECTKANTVCCSTFCGNVCMNVL
ncbi:protein WFDC10B [Talpa occidentalis]|uniref:protein WFDC10B n=1 Tax=Talpa occidentalis TaxID=50954 RepID=UPI00188DD21A|nr:protein WFDC10B [Talpa occidentalis]